MARQKSEKSRWASRYGGGWIADAPFLAELMVERVAKKDRRSLPPRFWDEKEWGPLFKRQLRFAQGLLRLYGVNVILRVLDGARGKSVYSLGANWLDAILQEEQKREDAQQASLRVVTPPRDECPLPSGLRPSFAPKPSPITRLRLLDE